MLEIKNIILLKSDNTLSKVASLDVNIIFSELIDITEDISFGFSSNCVACSLIGNIYCELQANEKGY